MSDVNELLSAIRDKMADLPERLASAMKGDQAGRRDFQSLPSGGGGGKAGGSKMERVFDATSRLGHKIGGPAGGVASLIDKGKGIGEFISQLQSIFKKEKPPGPAPIPAAQVIPHVQIANVPLPVTVAGQSAPQAQPMGQVPAPAATATAKPVPQTPGAGSGGAGGGPVPGAATAAQPVPSGKPIPQPSAGGNVLPKASGEKSAKEEYAEFIASVKELGGQIEELGAKIAAEKGGRGEGGGSAPAGKRGTPAIKSGGGKMGGGGFGRMLASGFGKVMGAMRPGAAAATGGGALEAAAAAAPAVAAGS